MRKRRLRPLALAVLAAAPGAAVWGYAEESPRAAQPAVGQGAEATAAAGAAAPVAAPGTLRGAADFETAGDPAAAGLTAAPRAAPAPETVGAAAAPLIAGEPLPLPELDPAVPAPPAVLGYPLGERFTHDGAIVGYFETLAAASPRVVSWRYGETYEHRPLTLVAVSSAANLDNLEVIRRRHLKLGDPTVLAEPEVRALIDGEPVVVWLAYGVHGNESSSSEAAMAAAYVLAAARGEAWEERLAQAVILIDPLSNPDGRARYVHAYEGRRGREPDPSPAAAEHAEPWPGGRYNHYLADLNRDWAWASQRETRARLAEYRRWEPQVYVDFHEMGSGSTYFFPPPAEPVHPAIDRRVVGWLDAFGRANAEAFDRLGWLFFKAQRYDLFYPGYGDSYPSLRGGVGMTYEVAGGGRAGQVLARPDGTLLTLADRVARHLATSLATVATAADNRLGLLATFAAARRAAAERAGRTYLWAAEQQEARALAELLELHGVRVSRLGAETVLAARPGAGGEAEDRPFAAGTYAVPTAQPLGPLVEALLEIDSPIAQAFVDRQRARFEEGLPDEIYDVTAWGLPLAFNLETWIAEGRPDGLAPPEGDRSGILGRGDVGYLVPPQGLAGYRLAASLAARGVGHRLALSGFAVRGDTYPAGTLLVPRHGNPAGLGELLAELAAAAGTRAFRVGSSFTDSGISLGSDEMVAVRPVRLALGTGPGTSPTSVGYLWHLLDQQLELPHSRIELAALAAELGSFDVVVLPGGDGYGERLTEEDAASLGRWVDAGGMLVAVGGAVDWLRQAELVSFAAWEADEGNGNGGRHQEEVGPSALPIDVQGAALATQLRASHPLAAGLPSAPSVLFIGSEVLRPAEDPRGNVLVGAEDPVIAGLAWPEAEERLAGALLVGEERRGKGRIVVFAQEPAFRLFWRATMPLFLNAVMYAPSF